LELKIAQGRDEGERGRQERCGAAVKSESSEKGLTAVKGVFVRILRARSEVPGKPGISRRIFGVFAPPESSEKICKEFDFG
jgi:hypothetical protein